jgi:hypothetical protein
LIIRSDDDADCGRLRNPLKSIGKLNIGTSILKVFRRMELRSWKTSTKYEQV